MIAKQKSSKRQRQNVDEEDEQNDAAFVPAKITQNILRQARQQQLEDDSENAESRRGRVKFAAGVDEDEDEQEEEEDQDDWDGGEDDGAVAFGPDDDVVQAGEYVGARMEASTKEDVSILRRFMPEDSSSRRTLADIIMAKLAEKEAAAATGGVQGAEDGGQDEGQQEQGAALDPRVISVYTDVGKYLSTYKSGKLPKVMKVIPSLARWEEILFLTNPESWTPHATYAATRIFASNLNAAKAQRFFNLVLLPKCRDDIFIHKRLNFHLYLALKKATYKPAAFYRGILLPLAAGGDCTLLEAIIVASVVKKSSIPQLHSAAALVKLAGLPYSGAVSVFLAALLDKKYTLPYLAIDAVVDHFLGFRDVPGPLPVLWHTSLLSLARRYKGDLSAEQKEGVKALINVHGHLAISAEVRRELAAAPSRGESLASVAGKPFALAAPAPAVSSTPAGKLTGPAKGKGKGAVEQVPAAAQSKKSKKPMGDDEMY